MVPNLASRTFQMAQWNNMAIKTSIVLLMLSAVQISHAQYVPHECNGPNDPLCNVKFYLDRSQFQRGPDGVPFDFDPPALRTAGDFKSIEELRGRCVVFANQELKLVPIQAGDKLYNMYAGKWPSITVQTTSDILNCPRGQRQVTLSLRFFLDDPPKTRLYIMPGYYGTKPTKCAPCKFPEGSICDSGPKGTGCCGVKCQCPLGYTSPIAHGCGLKCPNFALTCNTDGGCSGGFTIDQAGMPQHFKGGCICQAPYGGPLCDRTCSPPCQHGTCTQTSPPDPMNPLRCVCNPGWFGASCGTSCPTGSKGPDQGPGCGGFGKCLEICIPPLQDPGQPPECKVSCVCELGYGGRACGRPISKCMASFLDMTVDRVCTDRGLCLA